MELKATASSGLPVVFYASSSQATQVIDQAVPPPPEYRVCSVFGDIVGIENPGTCTILAYQAGDDLYAPAFLERSFTVTAP
jgi:hypothetical protein